RIARKDDHVRPVGRVTALPVMVGGTSPSDQPTYTPTSARSAASSSNFMCERFLGSVSILIEPSPGVVKPQSDVAVVFSSKQVVLISVVLSSPSASALIQSIFVSVGVSPCKIHTCVP